MSLPNPLTPRAGFTVAVTQLVGSHPVITSSCKRCAAFDQVTRVDVASSPAQLGEVVARLVDDAVHHVSSHITDDGERVTL